MKKTLLSKLRIYINELILKYLGMKKELKILRIMKEEKCCWEDAVKRFKERKTLSEFI